MSASRFFVGRSRSGLSLLEFVVVLVIIGVLIALLLPSLAEPPAAGHRRLCKNNLKQIGLALHNYQDVYGSLPPAVVYGPDGKPWHSWRTLILPYMEQQELYERYRFDEPWNGPHNQQLAKEIGTLPYFHCLGDEKAVNGETSYVAVTGKGTLWPLDRTISFDDVADGLYRTLMVVELTNSGVQWMEPRDLPFDRMTFEICAKTGVGIRGQHGPVGLFGGGDSTVATVLYGDGAVRVISGPETKPETVRSLLLRDDGGPVEEW